MAEARVAQLKRRVNELEAQLGQSRSLRQELDDRVHASKLLKANNLKLQNEVAALQRRLAEVEVIKDTKGTFIFGGGRTSNVALRRGLKEAYGEKTKLKEESNHEREQKEHLLTLVDVKEVELREVGEEGRRAAAAHAEEMKLAELDIAQTRRALEQETAQKEQLQIKLAASRQENMQLAAQGVQREKEAIRHERRWAWERATSHRTRLGHQWKWIRVQPSGTTAPAPKRPPVRYADEDDDMAVDHWAEDEGGDSGGEEGLEEEDCMLEVMLAGVKLQPEAMSSTSSISTFLEVHFAPAVPNSTMGVQRTESMPGMSPEFKTVFQYVMRPDCHLLESLAACGVWVELCRGNSVAGETAAAGAVPHTRATLSCTRLLAAQPGAHTAGGTGFEADASLSKVEWVEAPIVEGSGRGMCVGTLRAALRMRRQVALTSAMRIFRQLAPAARHPHAVAAVTDQEPVPVVLSWMTWDICGVLERAAGQMEAALQAAGLDGVVDEHETTEIQALLHALEQQVLQQVQSARQVCLDRLQRSRSSEGDSADSLITDAGREVVAGSVRTMRQAVVAVLHRLQCSASIASEGPTGELAEHMQQRLKELCGRLELALDMWERALVGQAGKRTEQTRGAVAAAEARILPLITRTGRGVEGVVHQLKNVPTGNQQAAQTLFDEMQAILENAKRGLDKELLRVKPYIVSENISMLNASGQKVKSAADQALFSKLIQETLARIAKTGREQLDVCIAAAKPEILSASNHLLQVYRALAQAVRSWEVRVAHTCADLATSKEAAYKALRIRIQASQDLLSDAAQMACEDILRVLQAIGSSKFQAVAPGEIDKLAALVFDHESSGVPACCLASIEQLQEAVLAARSQLSQPDAEAVWDHLLDASEDASESLCRMLSRIEVPLVQDGVPGSITCLLNLERGNVAGPIHTAVERLRAAAHATVHSITAAMEHLSTTVKCVLVPPPEPQKYFAKEVQAVQLQLSAGAQTTKQEFEERAEQTLDVRILSADMVDAYTQAVADTGDVEVQTEVVKSKVESNPASSQDPETKEGSDERHEICSTATKTLQSACEGSSPQTTPSPQETNSHEKAANVVSSQQLLQASTGHAESETEVELLGYRLDDFPAPGKESLLVVRAVARLCSFLEGGGVYIDKKFTTSPELFVALDANSDGLLMPGELRTLISLATPELSLHQVTMLSAVMEKHHRPADPEGGRTFAEIHTGLISLPLDIYSERVHLQRDPLQHSSDWESDIDTPRIGSPDRTVGHLR